MNVLETLIGKVSPSWGLKRLDARMKLDALGAMASGSGYGRHGGSTHKRSLFGWLLGIGGDPDRDITDNLATLRSRSRDLYMSGGLAAGAIKTVNVNVVGPGLRLNAQIDGEYLGMSNEACREWERRTEQEFALWAENCNCDASRTCDFYGLQRLVFMSFLMNGDAFALLPVIPGRGSPYSLRVRLLEGDRVCDPNNKPFGRDIREGVEVDKFGAPVAYWICQAHPGGTSFVPDVAKRRNTWVRCPAFGARSGRRNVLHLMDPERIEQRRGVPFLAPVIEDIKQLGNYNKAELMAAVVGGLLTTFITTDMPRDETGNPMVPFGDEPSGTRDDPQAIGLGSGTVVQLDAGEKIETVDPKRPNSAFEGFVTAVSRQIGAALGLPYEVLVKQFNSSYSASRASLLEAWKFFRTWRSWFVGIFCRPIYEAWLEEAVALGRIGSPGFFDDPMIRQAYCGAKWNGPSQGQVNPIQEVQAAKIRVEEGFSTRSQECAELTGGDWERNHHQRVVEEQARRDGGLVTPSGGESD